MKTLAQLFLVALLLMIAAGSTQAAGEFEVSGQLRLRTEFDKKPFDTSAAWDQFSEMRTRVAIGKSIAENAHAYIQFQDSRVAGDTTSWGLGASGTTNQGNNVDIHQAYIKIDNLFGEGWGAKGGRFEFNLGNERLFGAVGWSNVGRSWEGMQFWYDQPKFRVTPFWLKKAELRSSSYNQDYDLFGAVVDIKDLNWQSFIAMEKDFDSTGYFRNKLTRTTLGTYYKRKYNLFDFELNTAYQMGTIPSGMGPDTGTAAAYEVDISAIMFAFEVGYIINQDMNCRMAVGIDYASGDDGKDSTKFKAFNNLYYTGHKFRGYMDYFVGSNPEGLMDLIIRGRMDPMDGWTANADLHLFSTAQNYEYINTSGTNPDTTMTKDVGMEFDFSVTTSRVKGVNLVAGASYFAAKEAWAGMSKKDPGLWVWGMTTLNF